MVMRMSAPGLALGLVLGAGCFSEGNVYDDCAQVGCDSSSATAGSTSATTTVADTTATQESGEVESSAADTTAITTEPPTTSTSSTATTATSSSEGSSSTGDAPMECGNGSLEPDEECEDESEEPFDGCDACQISPQLVWAYEEDYGAGEDAVLALAADGAEVLVAAVVDGGPSFDDALWFRVDATGMLDPTWYQLAMLNSDNRVLTLTRRGSTCVLAGFTEGTDGYSIATGNTIDCLTGQFAAYLAADDGSDDIAPEQMRAVAVLGDGRIVVGGRRMLAGAMRGWINTLDASGQVSESVVWLDDAFFGDASEVTALALAPNDDVFVAGSIDVGGESRGFAAPLDLVTSMPAPFAPMATASVAADVRPLATGMAVAGWTISDAGDADARIELFPMGGGAPTVWTLAGPDDDRLHGITTTPDGLVATGETGGGGTGQDVLVVWLDEDLVEQRQAIWDAGAGDDERAFDIVGDDMGVTIGGTAAGAMLVQRWTIPEQ